MCLRTIELLILLKNYDDVIETRVKNNGEKKEDPTIYIGSGGVVYAL